jgi:signal transduction histidine kinase
MGLGLSVVKGAVETHGWEISVLSPNNNAPLFGGTAFRIRIPRNLSSN